MKKKLVSGILILAGFCGLVALLLLIPNQKSQPAATQQVADSSTRDSLDTQAQLLAGRYEDYDTALVSEEGYNKTVLFFHAPWCPECRAFEQSLINADLPSGLQILKVDYDSSAELKAQHAVTLQSTFVSVDRSGNTLSTWVGYGKDKSVDAIVSNL